MTVNIFTHKKRLEAQRNQTYIQINIANIMNNNNNSDKSSLKTWKKKMFEVFLFIKQRKYFIP